MAGESIMGPMLAGAGISAAGSLASSALGFWGANRQMKFQERMSSTAYQRAAEDMKKAGLNPMLMYGKGSPASTPTGASFTPENPLKDLPGTMGKALELRATNARIANETASMTAAVKEAEARTQLLHEQANNARIEAEIKRAEAGRQGDIGEQLRVAIENARRDLDVKTATIAHSGASTAELKERTRRENQIANAMEALIPTIVRGGKAVEKIVDWLANPDTSTWEELKPFLKNTDQAILKGVHFLLPGSAIVTHIIDYIKNLKHQGPAAAARHRTEVDAREKREQDAAIDRAIEEGRGYSTPLRGTH